MNWGIRIIIAYAAGVCFILYFVVRSMMLNTDMVEENYYDKELAYNTHIQGVDNAKNMANPIVVSNLSSQIEISIDSVVTAGLNNGEIHFYNPASEKSDKKFKLSASTSGKYIFNKSAFNKGKYYVKISFNFHQKPYYTEQVIFIQ